VRGGRVAIAAIVFVLLGLVLAGSAVACSCAYKDPSEALAASDAAVVARLLRVEGTGVEFHGVPEARFKYRILHVYRGGPGLRRGATLALVSYLSGAACGLPEGIGRHYGLFLYRHKRRWSSSSCGVVSPADLRAAAQRTGAVEPSPELNAATSCAS
jgi:hypothetical protein